MGRISLFLLFSKLVNTMDSFYANEFFRLTFTKTKNQKLVLAGCLHRADHVHLSLVFWRLLSYNDTRIFGPISSIKLWDFVLSFPFLSFPFLSFPFLSFSFPSFIWKFDKFRNRAIKSLKYLTSKFTHYLHVHNPLPLIPQEPPYQTHTHTYTTQTHTHTHRGHHHRHYHAPHTPTTTTTKHTTTTTHMLQNVTNSLNRTCWRWNKFLSFSSLVLVNFYTPKHSKDQRSP